MGLRQFPILPVSAILTGMRTKLLYGGLAIILAVILAYVVVISRGMHQAELSQSATDTAGALPPPLPASPLDASYSIDGREVRLSNGQAEQEAAPGSAEKVTTRVFGEPIYGDLNGDGTWDAALFLTQDTGGSGTFYYVAAAIREGDGYLGTNAVLLGDRIAPQNVQLESGLVVANYAERAPDEPMTAAPSIGVSKYLTLAGAELTDVGPLPQGESILEGTVGGSDTALVFSTCAGDRYTVAKSSRSFAALQTIYMERQSVSTSTTVYAIVAGAVSSARMTGTDGTLTVSRIVAVPEGGGCKTSNE